MDRPKKGLVDQDIVTRTAVHRRSALALLGVPLSLGGVATVLGGCAGVIDSDPRDFLFSGLGGGGGGGGGGSGGGSTGSSGGGSSGESTRRIDADTPKYADFRDLDSDARDRSDHAGVRRGDPK